MSMITSQIKNLRELAAVTEYMGVQRTFQRALYDAADTIENLSAKLSAANMERSTAYYNGGWIPCSQEMPKEKGLYLVSYGKDTEVIVESYNGVWFDEHYYFEQPKAWMHRPKPYEEGE